MKNTIALFKFFFVLLCVSGLLSSCQEDDLNLPTDQNDPVQDSIKVDAINADTLSNHLQFHNAEKYKEQCLKGLPVVL